MLACPPIREMQHMQEAALVGDGQQDLVLKEWEEKCNAMIRAGRLGSHRTVLRQLSPVVWSE